MKHFRHYHRALWLLALLCPFFSPSFSFAAYGYPYPDPFFATLTAGILKADERDSSARYFDFKVRQLPERDYVPYYGKSRNNVTVRLWPQMGKAPLVFLVAGLGAQANSGLMDYLAYWLFKRGFHALVLPSPFHWSFALSASKSGFPGLTLQDARDLNQLALTALQSAKEKRGLEVSRIGLLGVSMGALEAGFMATLDSQENKLSIERTLLINPPVDLKFGMKALDDLAKKENSISVERTKQIRKILKEFGVNYLVVKSIHDSDYFAGVEQNLPLSLEERKFLIGEVMREYLGPLIFTTQQLNDLGVLREPIAKNDPKPRLAEAATFSFFDYIEKFLLPGAAKSQKESIESLMKEAGFPTIENALRNNPSVFLIHNSDDFLVRGPDLLYLQNIFGDRMTLYPNGGHMGNVWFPENLEKILSTMEPLKAP